MGKYAAGRPDSMTAVPTRTSTTAPTCPLAFGPRATSRPPRQVKHRSCSCQGGAQSQIPRAWRNAMTTVLSRSPRWWPSAMIVTGAVGVGTAVTLSSRYRSADLWPVWATLAISLCGAAGVVWSYGRRRWHELSREWPVKAADGAWPTLAITLGALFSLAAGELSSARPGGAGAATCCCSWRSWAGPARVWPYSGSGRRRRDFVLPGSRQRKLVSMAARRGARRWTSSGCAAFCNA
jgi:hypothetical protein